ncbi:hypothetical protein KFZ58_18340 [Virgibacillus sp. NKC19-16]|uniref:hypothetical protein n=1 Tax=Virgibacillus salidurans TaxID=2831673 RepID=UPI001F3403B7|nr:hypothetical protein [Virgibacillus sp. NKC19-16]UJL46283.1 hypothetical protein KFZ58_18340 [Virgibacillus sp. NKC19-16]
MNALEVWNKIQKRDYEFEIHTVPRNHQEPLWFAVIPADDTLIIKPTTFKKPSVNISKNRKISFKEFERVHVFYDRWSSGEPGVRKEASYVSKNTAYIFALIERFEKKHGVGSSAS